MRSSSFRPIAGPNAQVLVLGTLPGAASLARGEYYAQPRNALWRIMGELAGASPFLPYDERLRRLVAMRIALWDVCASAERAGSLDSAIRSASVTPNDIAGFLRAHGGIVRICFNGAKAGALFRRHVRRQLTPPANTIPCLVLPSTSPAHASVPFDRKLAAWRDALIMNP
jgi:hypoxanthine-DNA glycosylase